MEYSLTIFKNIFDNKTNAKLVLSDVNKFENLFHGLFSRPAYKPKTREEIFSGKGSPLISPAIFEKNAPRRNVNVVCWGGWAALDVDDYLGTFEDAVTAFKDIRHLYYSSASSTKEHPKFRVVIPFTRTIKNEEIKHVWFALNSEFNNLGDPQTKDLSRMYYIPGQYENSYQFFSISDSKEFIDIDELKKKYPYTPPRVLTMFDSLPEDYKQKILQNKRDKLTNRNYSWTSFRDCEFVNQELVAKYFSITGTGWYFHMYKIMTSIAATAILKGYPITPIEITNICREIDRVNGTSDRYKHRSYQVEAARAIDFVLANSISNK